MTQDFTPMSFGAALGYWADKDADAPALTDDHETLTRRQFDALTNRYARYLTDCGVGERDIVTIALPNEARLLIWLFAAWKVGAAPQTLAPRMAQNEFQHIVNVGKPKVVIGAPADYITGSKIIAADFEPEGAISDAPVPDIIAPISRAPVSGGSTGLPKVIRIETPAVCSAEAGAFFRVKPEQTHVVPGRLYHGAPLILTCMALGLGCHVVLMKKFDAEDTLRLIDRHKADYAFLVPTMMQRMFKLPEETKGAYNIASLQTMFHTAAPCPAWLKQAWIDWVGAKTVFELYGMTEGLGAATIDGEEWLTHQGSVGRAVSWCEIGIFDEDGNGLPAGEIGEVYMRPIGFEAPYSYVDDKAKKRRLEGGWESGGDMGYLDEDGYLFLADRRTDMILVGGVNVYPAEVEAAIESHPAVRSCAVIGLPDDDMGNKVHAIVDAPDGCSSAELLAHLEGVLTPYKRPRSFEFVAAMLRDDAGKVRRSKLRDERLNP